MTMETNSQSTSDEFATQVHQRKGASIHLTRDPVSTRFFVDTPQYHPGVKQLHGTKSPPGNDWHVSPRQLAMYKLDPLSLLPTPCIH